MKTLHTKYHIRSVKNIFLEATCQ